MLRETQKEREGKTDNDIKNETERKGKKEVAWKRQNERNRLKEIERMGIMGINKSWNTNKINPRFRVGLKIKGFELLMLNFV